MEHRALALEYRPQSFEEIAGQHHVTAVLTRALAKGRVHSCYLFSGPRGVGKTTTARILAKILNCPNTKDGVPCNACEVCREITAGISLDVQEIDGASNRGIADVQQLREKVRFTPAGGRHRVIIIDEVHQLSGDAFAALLKTLEEPPPHVVFVFATTDPLKLPDTIRSRCQRYDFGRLALAAVVARLREIVAGESRRGAAITLTDEAAFLLARRSEGSMRDAVSALDQVLSTGVTAVDEAAVNEVLGLVNREVFFRLGEKILGGDPEGALAALHDAFRDGVDPRDLAEGLLEHVRGVLVLRLDPRAEDLVTASEDERRRLEAQGQPWDVPDLLRHMRLVTEAIGALRDSAQPLTHLELAVVEMASLEPGVRLAEILEKLGAMGGDSSEGAKGATRRAPPGRTVGGRASGVASGAANGAPVVVAPREADRSPAGSGAAMGAGVTVPAAAAVVSAVAAVAMAAPADTPAAEAAVAVAAPPDGDGRWADAVSKIKERRLMVGVFLDESQIRGWEGDTLEVVADEVHRSFLSKAENREVIESVLAGVYERNVRVRFVNGAASGRAGGSASGAPAPIGVQPARAAGEPGTPPATVEAARLAAPAAPAASTPAEARSEPPAARRARAAAVSPEVERAMVLFDADIVKQVETGGPGR